MTTPFYIPEPDLFERLRLAGLIKYQRDDLLEALSKAQSAEQMLNAAIDAARLAIDVERQRDFDNDSCDQGEGNWFMSFYLPSRCFELHKLSGEDLPTIIKGTPRQLRQQAAAMRAREAKIRKAIKELS